MRVSLCCQDFNKRFEEIFKSLTIVNISDKDTITYILDSELKDMSLPKGKVFILSKTPNFEDAQKYILLGAMGYGNVLMSKTHILSSYQALKDGNMWIYPDFISAFMNLAQKNQGEKKKHLEQLTQREQEVALLLVDGMLYRDIADKLNITPRTVKAHVASIYQKLEVKDRLALALLFRD